MNKQKLQGCLPAYSANAYQLSFIASIIILFCLVLFRILLVLSYNGEIGGIDNNFVYAVLKGIKNYDLYPNPAKLPYAVNMYPPLYYNLCAGIGKLLHINSNDPIHIYQLCRSVSLCADVITCGFLYKILNGQDGSNKKLSLLFVACFACILCFLGYTFSRCDSIYLTFYAAIIYILTSTKYRNNTFKIFLLAFLSVACIISKQNGILVPLLIVSWLLLHNSKRSAVYFFISFVIILISVILFYLYISKCSFLFENTVLALQNRIDLSWFYVNVFKRSIDSLWILPLYFSTIIAIKFWAASNSIGKRSLAILFIIQIVFSLGTTLKWGSTVGYFNESFLLAFILISHKINEYSKSNYSRKIIAWSLPIFIIFFIHTIAQGYLFFIQKREEKLIQYNQQKEVRDYLLPKLQENFVLAPDHPNTDFFKTFFYKNIAVPNFDIVDCCTLPDHTFDYSSLAHDFSTGEISYIITEKEIIPPAIWGISLQSFYKDTTIYGYTIYHFKSQ